MSEYRVLLVGNPNCGKSTLFNTLTNLNQKTGNFSGVTIEKKIGKLENSNKIIEIIDLPGAFSLYGISEDKIALTEAIMQRKPGDKILFVMDSNLIERSLQFLLQITDLGAEVILVLTMNDILKKKNITLDLDYIRKELNINILTVNAKKNEGIEELKDFITNADNFLKVERKWKYDDKKEEFVVQLLNSLNTENQGLTRFVIENSLKKFSGEVLQDGIPDAHLLPKNISEHILNELKKSNLKFTYRDELISKSIYIKKIISKSINSTQNYLKLSTLDKYLIHPYYGMTFFLVLMALVFQALFNWSEAPMKLIESGFDFLGDYCKSNLPTGPLSLLLSEGIIKGIGAVFVFIPQISLLFLFIGLLEESGYMARAAFVMDKFMGKFGLSGKSFIPLLSSAACAVPAILGSRTIEDKQDRMITILVSPLITCSARYPVYILVIGAIFSNEEIIGVFNLKGLILFLLFFLGLLTALVFAFIFKKTFFNNDSSYFILELPEYKLPSLQLVLRGVYLKIKTFIIGTGTIILYISIILWFLVNYPYNNSMSLDQLSKNKSEIQILNSYAAQLGKNLEPLIEPLGFDWKIGISLITSFAAREVMVSTLAIIYGVDSGDENSQDLKTAMQDDINPKTGRKVWTTLSGISVLLFFAYACQCMSTLAVVRKETNSYLMPFFLFSYMTILAYLTSLIVFQVGLLFGFG